MSYLWRKLDINDLYEYMTYLKDKCNDSAVTRARKVASIRAFFKYLTQKAKILEINPKKSPKPKIAAGSIRQSRWSRRPERGYKSGNERILRTGKKFSHAFLAAAQYCITE